MRYVYFATMTEDPDGGILVTFADVPEAITAGDTHEDALTNARDALGLALRGILADERTLPQPKAKDGIAIAVDADVAAKLAVIQAFRKAEISKSELARRLGKSENEARRLLDPDHPSKIGPMQDALRALGMQMVVTVQDAA